MDLEYGRKPGIMDGSGFFFFWVYCYCCSVAQSCLTPNTAAHQAFLSITNSQSLLKLKSIESVMPSKHLILCCLLLLTSIFSSIKVFSNELALRIRWPNYWSFSISPSNEYSGLISFRNDWFDLLAVQGTLKSLLQQHSSKATILWCSRNANQNYEISIHTGQNGYRQKVYKQYIWRRCGEK